MSSLLTVLFLERYVHPHGYEQNLLVEWVSLEMNKMKRMTGFRLFEILDGVFGYKKVSKSDEMMVGKVLTELGYTKTKKTVGGIRAVFWTLEQ